MKASENCWRFQWKIEFTVHNSIIESYCVYIKYMFEYRFDISGFMFCTLSGRADKRPSERALRIYQSFNPMSNTYFITFYVVDGWSFSFLFFPFFLFISSFLLFFFSSLHVPFIRISLDFSLGWLLYDRVSSKRRLGKWFCGGISQGKWKCQQGKRLQNELSKQVNVLRIWPLESFFSVCLFVHLFTFYCCWRYML